MIELKLYINSAFDAVLIRSKAVPREGESIFYKREVLKVVKVTHDLDNENVIIRLNSI